MEKILLIDKPKEWTSFDVVAKVRNELRKLGKSQQGEEIPGLPFDSEPLSSCSRFEERPGMTNAKIKVGHAGTLDPFATGLLIVLLGDATKKQDQFMKLDKEYEATLKLGFTSTTGDPEGVITPYSSSEAKRNREVPKFSTPSCSARTITQEVIVAALESLQGEISQTPPIYSAIKVNGQRAYKLARAGKNVELKPRKVTIFKLQIVNYKFPLLEIKVSCSSGTYIRTLAEDIGKILGCGAYLTALRRTEIGKFSVYDSQNIEKAINNIYN